MIRALLAALLLIAASPAATIARAAPTPGAASPTSAAAGWAPGAAALLPLADSLGAPAVARPLLPLAQTLSNAESRAVESARGGRYDEAIALTSQLIDREPDRLNSRLIRAMSYYYSARLPEALGDLDFALDRTEDGTGRTLRALVHLEL